MIARACRTYDGPCADSEDEPQLHRCRDRNHCNREPQESVTACDPVDNNNRQCTTNYWNEDQHFEAQAEHCADENTDHQEYNHATPILSFGALRTKRRPALSSTPCRNMKGAPQFGQNKVAALRYFR